MNTYEQGSRERLEQLALARHHHRIQSSSQGFPLSTINSKVSGFHTIIPQSSHRQVIPFSPVSFFTFVTKYGKTPSLPHTSRTEIPPSSVKAISCEWSVHSKKEDVTYQYHSYT
jgi:hypothetical protein